ncbi:zymogen granule membrane protein 16-like [Echeneis naucrates]|uniref:Zymogen granule membrane protein 16-like n=1 Tax=Echeneis naucrates TaxID=173247 RepID=A0A665U4P0_ECHNA|nr:zymogen granule membrane protein 16-like [Echeneis naucrates]
MQYIAVLALLLASVLADGQPQYYSYSPAVGSGSGVSYSLSGEGRITAIRVWDNNNGYIYGIQFRYGFIWSPLVGRKINNAQEIQLFDDEAIVQVSGKYAHYLQSVVFTTNRGRTLRAGQPSGHSFNMYANHSKAELRLISGRVHGGLTSIATHWGVVYPAANSTAEH